MPRTARIAPGGMVFHVLNRANAGARIFHKVGDYQAFLGITKDTAREVSMRILAYGIMPNHWHMVLWPLEDGDLGTFMHRLTVTHVRRWHLHRDSVGSGHLYQGAYKSFPVEEDDHFLIVCRYVERNALRAGLARSAENWPWGSAGAHLHDVSRPNRPTLDDWPLPRPHDWLHFVNQPQTEAELAAVRDAVQRGHPFGSPGWQEATAKQLGLESTLRPRGRPRKRKRG